MMIYVRDGALLKPAVDDLLGMMVTVGDGKFRSSAGAVTAAGRAA